MLDIAADPAFSPHTGLRFRAEAVGGFALAFDAHDVCVGVAHDPACALTPPLPFELRDVWRHIAASDRARARWAIRRARSHRRALAGTLHVLEQDGGMTALCVRVAPDGAGGVIMLAFPATDLAQGPRPIARDLQDAIAAADLGFWRYDARDDRAEADPRARALASGAADPDCKHPLRHMAAIDRRRARDAVEAADPETGLFAVTYATADGAKRLRAAGRVRRDADGEVLGVTGVLHDVTTEEASRHTAKAAADEAWDYFERIAVAKAQIASVRQAIDGIAGRAQAHDAAMLAGALSDLAGALDVLEAREEDTSAPERLGDVICDVAAYAIGMGPAGAHVDAQCALDADEAWIAHAAGWRSALARLAAHAAQTSQSVVIAADVDSGSLRVTLSMTGADAAALSAGTRALSGARDASLAAPALVYVRSRARALGGTVTLTDTADGAAFVVVAPQAEAPAHTRPLDALEPDRGRVLIVEPRRERADAVAGVVRSLGLETVRAADAEDAAAIARVAPLDLAIASTAVLGAHANWPCAVMTLAHDAPIDATRLSREVRGWLGEALADMQTAEPQGARPSLKAVG